MKIHVNKQGMAALSKLKFINLLYTDFEGEFHCQNKLQNYFNFYIIG
jgi:hypothetical protein